MLPSPSCEYCLVSGLGRRLANRLDVVGSSLGLREPSLSKEIWLATGDAGKSFLDVLMYLKKPQNAKRKMQV